MPQSQINKLFETIDGAIGDFQKVIPGIQQNMLDDIVTLAKELKIVNGRIANTVENFKILGQIKNRLQKVILNKDYKEAVQNFIGAFDQVTTIQNNYFATLASRKTTTTSDFLKEVKKASIESTVTYLTETGLQANVIGKVEDIIRQNITTGGKFSDFVTQMHSFLTTDQNSDGALARYTHQIVTDSLNTYSRTYMQTVTDDLGLEWYMYTGSLKTSSREWCIHMHKKFYIHKSELWTVLNDNIDGVEICSTEIPCNKKTNLPNGLKAETTADNLQILAGGWECGHSFVPVHELAVPKDVQNKVYLSVAYKNWCKENGVTPKQAA